jgi:hypothetical protein
MSNLPAPLRHPYEKTIAGVEFQASGGEQVRVYVIGQEIRPPA